MIALEIHICNQRRSYLARFATEAQALAFVTARESTHVARELEAEPLPENADALLTWLYPACEHGLSAANCFGPQHYYYDLEEQGRGFLNS